MNLEEYGRKRPWPNFMFRDLHSLRGPEKNHKMVSRLLGTRTRFKSGVALIQIRTGLPPGPNSLGTACTNENLTIYINMGTELPELHNKIGNSEEISSNDNVLGF
jgi:hypothetical protein